jgi:hypothetical protein
MLFHVSKFLSGKEALIKHFMRKRYFSAALHFGKDFKQILSQTFSKTDTDFCPRTSTVSTYCIYIARFILQTRATNIIRTCFVITKQEQREVYGVLCTRF